MCKFLLINDIKSIIDKKKYLFIYLLSIILYPIFIKFVLDYDFRESNIIEIFYQNVGGTTQMNSLIEYSQLILNVGFIVYVTVYLFNLNIDYGKEIVFLRIPYQKWLDYKLLSETLIVTIISIIEFLVLILLYSLFGTYFSIIKIFSIIINSIISNIILMLITIGLFQVSKKYFAIILSLIYLITIILSTSSTFEFLSNIIFSSFYKGYEIIYLIILYIIIYKISIFNIYKIFRRK